MSVVGPGEVGGPLPTPEASVRRALHPVEDEELVLAELVSRVLDRGVVVAGDVMISIAGVDLVHLALRVRLSSVEALRRRELRRPPPQSELPGDRSL